MKKLTTLLTIAAATAAVLTFPASAVSVGIIGGADGPTVIALTAKSAAAPAVKVATVSSTRVNVSWNKVDGAEKYALYMKSEDSGYKLLSNTTALSYTVPKLTQEKQYKFKVVPLSVSGGKTIQGKQSEAVTGATGGYYKKSWISYGRTGGTGVKDTYTYDSKGNMIADTENNTGFHNYKRVRTYDTAGNVLTYTNYTDGKATEKDVYTYDSKGNVLTMVYNYSDSDSGADGKRVYTYDSGGNRLTDTLYNPNGSVNIKTVYTYDSEGNMLTNTWSSSFSAGKEVYTYDTKGNMLTRTEYESDGSVYLKHVYTRDSDGNALTYTEYNAKGIVFDKYSYTYDSKGNKLTETSYKPDGSVSSKSVYTYDSKGNVLTNTWSLSVGTGGKEVYTY